jgi:gliding motility-associated-like protein
MRFITPVLFACVFLFASCGKEEVMTFDDQITVAQDFKVDAATNDTFYRIYMPSAFTPNEDGINDLYIVYGMGFNSDEFVMSVFSREGNLIYYSRYPNQGFDGSVTGHADLNPQQVYTVDIEVQDTTGELHHYNYKVLQMY